MQQFASCLGKTEPFPTTRIGTPAGPRELCIPLPSLGPDLSLMISTGSALDGPSIYAWLQSRHGAALASGLATFEAPLTDCWVDYDGFGGDPLMRIGSATFRVDRQCASMLERRFAFQVQGWDD
jgi:hypothetical protein